MILMISRIQHDAANIFCMHHANDASFIYERRAFYVYLAIIYHYVLDESYDFVVNKAKMGYGREVSSIVRKDNVLVFSIKH